MKGRRCCKKINDKMKKKESVVPTSFLRIKDVSPLEPVPGSPLCLGVGSSAAGPRPSPGSLQQRSVSAAHSLIAPTWPEKRHTGGYTGVLTQ